MEARFNITASIVVYKEQVATLQKAVRSFLESPFAEKLFIIDNSHMNVLESEFDHPNIEYIFVGKNIGFASGHNTVLKRLSDENSDFHLILNPDVEFDPAIFEALISELQKGENLSMIAPKILFPDQSLQYTARRFPKLSELFYRFLKISNAFTQKQEYRDSDFTTSFDPDFVHGSFMLFKTEYFLELKGFDERYFMYMEDVDICRRIDGLGKKKRYFPAVTIQHEFRKGSSKQMKLFLFHLSSVIKYYKKWGL